MSNKYKPVGRCIYCGDINSQLTDEHIIPYGLNGTLVLPKSSCLDCNKITSRIENNVLRGQLRDVRAALNFKTRRPKERPKTFRLGIVRFGVEKQREVPYEDHVIYFPMPIFGLPGFITRQPDKALKMHSVQTIYLGDRERVLQKYKAESISHLMRIDAFDFARMIAKIAYCYLVAEKGIDYLNKPNILSLIHGDGTHAGTWVGSSNEIVTADSAEFCLRYETYIDFSTGEPQGYALVYVKLFANISSPIYLVLVGPLSSEATKGIHTIDTKVIN